MKRFSFILLITSLTIWLACSSDTVNPPPPEDECPAATPLTLQIPDGFPRMVIPGNNPMTVEGVALGRRLFYDPILSGDSTQACGSCHMQEFAFGDSARFSTGITGEKGTRQAPHLTNAGWLRSSFWDGRSATLEDQARGPVPNPIEMNQPWSGAIAKLERHSEYPDFFCAAFGSKEITIDRVVMAIAQFERTFISANSKYDKWLRGEATFDAVELKGFGIFFTEIGDCFHCHGQAVGTDHRFVNTGLDSILVDQGRGAVTGDSDDDMTFKSPSIRNAMVSAPYMHDGRFSTIDEVLAHYNGGFFNTTPNVEPLISARNIMRPGQVDTLKVFLMTLTDHEFLTNPDLSNPFVTPGE